MFQVSFYPFRLLWWGLVLINMLFFSESTQAASKASHVKVLVRWSTPSRPVRANWAPNGLEVVYHFMRSSSAVVERYHVGRRKRKIVAQGKNSFYPCFGPASTIVAGPAHDQPILIPLPHPRHKPKALRKKPSSRHKSKALRKRSHPRHKPKALRKRSHPRHKPRRSREVSKRWRRVKRRKPGSFWWRKKTGTGIVMFGYQQQTFLFPGFGPVFSKSARRLLFSYRGILYLWNPLKSRRKGLLLLSKGFSPRWSYDGRAIAWLRRPFSMSPRHIPQGGGIVLVDMLFRGARVTRSGGQVSWAPDNRSLFYVDRANNHANPKKSDRAKAAIFQVSLRKRKAISTLIRLNAWSPALPVQLTKHTKDLLAFADAKGVWLMHRRSRKVRLVAAGASLPVWSTQNTLLVHYPRALAVLQISSDLQSSLK